MNKSILLTVITLCLVVENCVFIKGGNPVSSPSFYSEIGRLNTQKIRQPYKVVTITNPYFEKSVYSYLSQDAIVKNGGFLSGIPNDVNEYKRGYHVVNFNLLAKLRHSQGLLSIDSSAVVNFYAHVNSVSSTEPNGENDVNPFCGGYYNRSVSKISCLYMGDLEQRVPLFVDCEGYRVYEKINKGKNYQIIKVPTYLIIDAEYRP